MKIQLSSGRTIALSSLRQSLTYQGLLAGLPTRQSNEDRIARDVEKARALCPGGGEPVLIPPAVTVTGRRVRGLEVPEERLPRVACLAVFDSGPLERDDSEPYSSVVVVWYQDEFGLPHENALAWLRAIDWETMARDWCW